MLVLLALAVLWAERTLRRTDFVSGISLATACFAMMLLSIRKVLLVLPMGAVKYWQQTHHYLGLFAVGAYLMHAGIVVHGAMEILLAILFWSISLSGLLGWYINVSTPRKLRAAGNVILRDDIETQRRGLAEQAYAIALKAAGKNESACLAEHYLKSLQPFFHKRPSLAYCLNPNGKRRRHLLHELDQVKRYLGPEGRASQATLSQLVQKKDDLDFQWALQNRLRGWVIVHVSLVWSFYLVAACHIYTVVEFHGR